MRDTLTPLITKLPNGKYRHCKSKVEWPDKISAQTDLRFCIEWENAELRATTAERDRAQQACEQIAKRLGG